MHRASYKQAEARIQGLLVKQPKQARAAAAAEAAAATAATPAAAAAAEAETPAEHAPEAATTDTTARRGVKKRGRSSKDDAAVSRKKPGRPRGTSASSLARARQTAAAAAASSSDSSDSDDAHTSSSSGLGSSHKLLGRLTGKMQKAMRAKLEVRPFYSSEEEDADAAAAAAGESTNAEEEDADVPPPRATAAASSSSSAPHPLHRLVQERLKPPHAGLTMRLLKRTAAGAPPLKQWPLALAVCSGTLAEPVPKSRPGWKFEPVEEGAAASLAGKRNFASAHFSRPFDILPDAPSSSSSAAAAAAASSSSSSAAVAAASSSTAAAASSSSASAAPTRYWSYLASGITRMKKDPGYTVTNHGGYTDHLAVRASPPLTPSELAALVPVSAEDACRENGLTLLRHQRVKLADRVKARVNKAIRSVTGELDRKVLAMCDNGTISKCRLYRTDDYNITLLSTERILSGEPIGVWMGTLRSRRTFAQRVGLESSLAHIWAYETPAVSMPSVYYTAEPREDEDEVAAACPDLVHDGVAYGNETHFLRDPKWSHQRADANIASRLVWHQRSGLPYIAFVTLCDIEPHAELFIDWGDKCWRNVWRTQLTALAANSHLQHVYLKQLQRALAQAGVNMLPQQPASRFKHKPDPDTEESEEQRIFLDEQTSPFATTSAVQLGLVTKQEGAATAAAAASSSSSSPSSQLQQAPLGPVAAAAAAAAATVASAATSAVSSSPPPPTVAASITPSPDQGVSFDHTRADADAAASAASNSGESSSADNTNPSSPYTPSFNTHKAFVASASHTMLTVFAAALLRENTKEIARIDRRLTLYRLNRYRRPPRVRKPLLEGAIHVQGQHTFEILRDPKVAFVKSGTRMGREAKVDVSEETKQLIQEAFKNLRPIDFPDKKDAKLIRDGNVPRAAIYEVVGLKHPARFFTRPDQSAFSLVATKPYQRGDPIGAYIGVFRDFEQFHKASNKHAMKQVYAYDCLAPQIPGPPNPHLSEREKARPLEEQLAYRGSDLIVESLYYGNEVRFMNDCYGRRDSDATVNAHATIAWDRERQWPTILVRASFKIPKGDEIIVDYGDEFWNKVARSLMMDHAAYGDEVRELIRDTEEWAGINHVPLPPRPQKLPQLFTNDREKDLVLYPREFMQDAKAAAANANAAAIKSPQSGGSRSSGELADGDATPQQEEEKKEPSTAEIEAPSRKRARIEDLKSGLSSLASKLEEDQKQQQLQQAAAEDMLVDDDASPEQECKTAPASADSADMDDVDAADATPAEDANAEADGAPALVDPSASRPSSPLPAASS